jgi:hypothetical protein
MKRASIIIALICFFSPIRASAVELLVSMTELVDYGEFESTVGGYITKLDTDTGARNHIFRYIDLGWLSSLATAPDGSVYFSVFTSVYDAGTYLGYAYRIWKITPSITMDGEVAYGSETMIFEVLVDTDGTSTDERISQIRDLAVRHNSDTDVNRVYFSTATGAAADGHIYYVDDAPDFGPAVEYYTVVLESIPIPSCWAGGSWGGNFAFDESENLFLSSGHCIPSALYKVSGAGFDSVDGEAVPELIYERAGVITDLLVLESGRIHFLPDEPSILFLTDGAPPTEDALFSSDPTVQSIGEIAPWPSEAIGRLPSLKAKLEASLKSLFKPDLLITNFSVFTLRSGPSRSDKGLPVRISIKNSGTHSSTSFRVSFIALYPGQKSPVPVSFSTPGLSPEDSGLIKGLQAGGEISLLGFLKIEPTNETKKLRKKVVITAFADSCQGDSDMPQHCRVQEKDEKNNQMSIEILQPNRQAGKK